MSSSRIVRFRHTRVHGSDTRSRFRPGATADDFLPVVQGGPSEVKEPERVNIKGKVVSAATPQDAINAAVGENAKDLKNGDTPEVGAKWSSFRAGWDSSPPALEPTVRLRIPP